MDTSAPLASWMAAGGDERQVLLEATGLTKYRTAHEPRDNVPLGSCTASSPSRHAWRAMSAELARWREAANPDAAIEGSALTTRQRLRNLLGLPRQARLALLPSGTDAIYLVSAVALQGVDHVHHVVVGASELGGGTLIASRGEVFSPRVPLDRGQGVLAEVGAPVDELSGRCSATPVYLRAPDGERLDIERIDAEVAEVARAAAARGERAIVHLVAHSKTGLRAPSMQAMLSLQSELGDRLVVLVDAAQGRVAPADVRHALDHGFVVLWTGSKFYGGPPFSATLLFPQAFSEDPGPLPRGLGAWVSRFDLPREWPSARDSMPVESNPGLLLRWVGALAETEAYHALAEPHRGRVYHAFAASVTEVFGPSHRVKIDMPHAPVHRLATSLGAYPSVFGFRVRDDDGWLSAARLKRLHALLDTDLSHEDPALGGEFHLGQPVSLGPPDQGVEAVLRVALGARLVTELANSADAGAAWLRAELGRVRRKTEFLIDSGRLEAE